MCVIDFGRAVLDPSEQQCMMEIAQLDDMWGKALYSSRTRMEGKGCGT